MIKKVGKIEIKSNWDERISWYKDIPNNSIPFELNAYHQIKSFLLRNSSGSLIISGERGVGKTTTVINVVRDCETEKEVFPVYLNSLHLDAYNEDDKNVNFKMQKMLRLLIRSLANEMSKHGVVPQELKNLINDCDATKLSSSHITSKKKKVNMFQNTGLFFSNTLKFLGINIEAGVNTAMSFDDENKEMWEKSGITIEDIVDRFSEVINKIENQNNLKNHIRKSHTYTKKFCGKEFKFIILHPEKNYKKRKLVFILDELDIYEGDSQGKVTAGDVLNTMKRFKNLFTLSNAHFIFIVGKKTYLKTKVDPYRTLFSERCFLSTPDGEKLITLLDNIIIGKIPESISQDEWEEYKWFFISKSKHNLYDLISIVNANSHFNEETKQYFLEISKETLIDKAITSMHYLLNAVFVYHRQSSIFEYYNDNLFQELLLIENKFKLFLLNGEDTVINLSDLHTDNNNISDEEVRSSIKKAKISLVKTLYLYLNKPAPAMNSNSIKLPWGELRDTLMFKHVKKGILGVITEPETTLINNFDNLISNLKIKYDPYFTSDKLNIDEIEYIKNVYNLLNIEINELYINIIQEALNQISTLPADKRDWDKVTQANQYLVALQSQLDTYLTLGNNMVSKVNWGEISIKDNCVHLGSNISHGNKLMSNLSIHLPHTKNSNFIELYAKIKLNQNSLINFLFYKQIPHTEIGSDFYMARFDSRESNPDCLLYKPNGSYWSTISDSTSKSKNSLYNTWFQIKITLKNGYIEVRKRKKKNYWLISKEKININCVAIGISNESAPNKVIIESLQINDKTYR